MVPRAGFEPARPFDQGILSPWRLPVTPSGDKIGGGPLSTHALMCHNYYEA